MVSCLPGSPSSALSPTFLGEGSPTKLDYRKKVPFSILSTGGPTYSFWGVSKSVKGIGSLPVTYRFRGDFDVKTRRSQYEHLPLRSFMIQIMSSCLFSGPGLYWGEQLSATVVKQIRWMACSLVGSFWGQPFLGVFRKVRDNHPFWRWPRFKTSPLCGILLWECLTALI